MASDPTQPYHMGVFSELSAISFPLKPKFILIEFYIFGQGTQDAHGRNVTLQVRQSGLSDFDIAPGLVFQASGDGTHIIGPTSWKPGQPSVVGLSQIKQIGPNKAKAMYGTGWVLLRMKDTEKEIITFNLEYEHPGPSMSNQFLGCVVDILQNPQLVQNGPLQSVSYVNSLTHQPVTLDNLPYMDVKFTNEVDKLINYIGGAGDGPGITPRDPPQFLGSKYTPQQDPALNNGFTMGEQAVTSAFVKIDRTDNTIQIITS